MSLREILTVVREVGPVMLIRRLQRASHFIAGLVADIRRLAYATGSVDIPRTRSATHTVVVVPVIAGATPPVEYRGDERQELPVAVLADVVPQRCIHLQGLLAPARLGAASGERASLAQKSFQSERLSLGCRGIAPVVPANRGSHNVTARIQYRRVASPPIVVDGAKDRTFQTQASPIQTAVLAGDLTGNSKEREVEKRAPGIRAEAAVFRLS